MNAVVWLESELDKLADVWIDVTPEERDRIEAAVNRINATLARDAGAGESRSGNHRILHVSPVTVRFRPESDSTVVVASVHYARPRR